MDRQEIWKITTILRALLMGMRLEHDGRRWEMDSTLMLCNVAVNQHGDESLLVVGFRPGIALAEFCDWALTFTDEEMEIIGANITLNEIKSGT